jgi:hypothetical protein
LKLFQPSHVCSIEQPEASARRNWPDGFTSPTRAATLSTFLVCDFLVVRKARPNLVEHPDQLADLRIPVEPSKRQHGFRQSAGKECGTKRIASVGCDICAP